MSACISTRIFASWFNASSRADMTIVCVTHEMGFARAVADRVILMADGKIVETGTPEQMFTAPRNEITRAFMQAVQS